MGMLASSIVFFFFCVQVMLRFSLLNSWEFAQLSGCKLLLKKQNKFTFHLDSATKQLQVAHTFALSNYVSIWTHVYRICIYLFKIRDPTTSSSCWYEGPVIALYASCLHCIRERKTVAAWKAVPAKSNRHGAGLSCERSQEMEDYFFCGLQPFVPINRRSRCCWKWKQKCRRVKSKMIDSNDFNCI